MTNEILCELYQNGDENALSELIQNNSGLVREIINKSSSRYHTTLDYDDLVSVGNIGIIEAAKKFDKSKGCKFTTYAGYYIRKNIKKEQYNNGTTIRIPIEVYEKMSKILSSGKEDNEMTEKELNLLSLFNRTLCPRSLDSSAYDLKCSLVLNDTTTLDECITYDDDVSPEEEMYEKSRLEELYKIIDELPYRQKETIRLRYFCGCTFDVVAKKLGVSRQRAHQLEQIAIHSMKRKVCKCEFSNVSK